MASKIKKGDLVVVLVGKSKGVAGKVLQVFPEAQRLLVKGAALCMRHKKPSVEHPEGGKILKESAMHCSNVALLDHDQRPTRVGFKINADGKKVRFAKRSGHEIGVSS